MGWTLAECEASVVSMVSQEVPLSLDPPRRIALALALAPTRQPTVLCIGGPLPSATETMLLSHGCGIETVGTLADGLREMTKRRYDVVVVRPTHQVDGDGVRFVRSIKSGGPSKSQTPVAFVASAYRQVPFLILPMTGTTEYALFKNSKIWFLADTDEVPIARAILHAGN